MKLAIAISLALVLVGCETPPLTGSSGRPVSAKTDYQCKQQCGMYDPRASIIGSAMCMNECVKASGE